MPVQCMLFPLLETDELYTKLIGEASASRDRRDIRHKLNSIRHLWHA